MNNKRNIRKRLIILGIVLVIIAGIITGVILYASYRNDQKTVEVMPMTYVSSTYWGDQTSCDGNIVSDYIQELYPDSSKHIDEIFVEEGQLVSVGDPLLQYDRTSLELDVEAKQIAQQQVQVRIDEANRMLKKLQNSKPLSTSSNNGGGTVIIRPTPKPTATPKPTPTPKPTAAPTAVPTPTPFPTPDVAVYDELTPESIPYKGTGTSEDPYVFLCKDGFTLTPEFMRLLFGLNGEPSTPEPDQPDPGSDDLATQESGEEVGEGETPVEFLTSEQENPPETTTTGLGSPFAAVFEIREHDSNYGELLSAVTLDGHELSGALSVAGLMNGIKAAQEVITIVTESEPEYRYATPTPKPTATPAPVNYDGMYTRSELDALIKEKKQEISQLQYNLKQAKLDLEKAQRALDNSTVTSTIDGEIRSLIDIDTAMAESRPFMVVSGAQQYFVNGTISENLLGSIAPGDEVTVNSWMNGMTYTAQIVSISDYPTENGYYYGAGNPNSSNYEFTAVLLDADDTIQNGSYVDITLNINDTSPSDAFYLQKMYIREDDYGYYVMKAGKDNRLVKEHITVGKSIWGGEALEIKSGLTMEDFVAFPYGPDTKEGVRVVLRETGEPPWPEEGDDGADDSSGLPDDEYGGEDPGMDVDFAVPDTFDAEMEVE